MEYPRKITRAGVIFYADEPYEGKNRRGRYYAFISYISPLAEERGYIRLEEGWQDENRVWTAQDIYWEDKYDCTIMQREAA